MLKQHKVFVVGGNYAVERIFKDQGATLQTGAKTADIIVFTGGEDVSPDLYGDSKHPATYNNPDRDEFEFGMYKATAGKLRVGICRGGQFLNVMNGGGMWQHSDNHGIRGTHTLRYDYPDPKLGETSKFISVTSTHHQIMMPNAKIAHIWGKAGLTTFKEAGGPGSSIRRDMPTGHMDDVEIVWYAASRSLCFQPHPEYMSESTRILFFECIERALTV